MKRPAKIRLVGSSIQFAAEFHGWETWANFPLERQRFIDNEWPKVLEQIERLGLDAAELLGKGKTAASLGENDD